MTPTDSKWIALRTAAFVVLALFISLGPSYRQIFEKKSQYLRSWTMFRAYGKDICDVTYLQHRSGGEVVELDRFELLEYPDPFKAPKSVRALKTVEEAENLGKRICPKLEEGERDLRLVARCGSKQGWQSKSEGAANLCEKTARKGPFDIKAPAPGGQK